MPVLELDQLENAYGEVKALDDLSLSVPNGALYGLLGPNGAGKTTTMSIIPTLLAPDPGNVRVGGVDALNDPRAVRRLLGYITQEVTIDNIPHRAANCFSCKAISTT
jgi:ABC-type multidrug transport system, ATPase component